MSLDYFVVQGLINQCLSALLMLYSGNDLVHDKGRFLDYLLAPILLRSEFRLTIDRGWDLRQAKFELVFLHAALES